MCYTMRFGRLIQERRKKMHYSQEYLAEQCDLSPRHISDIENGKSNPRLETVVRLCKVCEINIGELPPSKDG